MLSRKANATDDRRLLPTQIRLGDVVQNGKHRAQIGELSASRVRAYRNIQEFPSSAGRMMRSLGWYFPEYPVAFYHLPPSDHLVQDQDQPGSGPHAFRCR